MPPSTRAKAKAAKSHAKKGKTSTKSLAKKAKAAKPHAKKGKATAKSPAKKMSKATPAKLTTQTKCSLPPASVSSKSQVPSSSRLKHTAYRPEPYDDQYADSERSGPASVVPPQTPQFSGQPSPECSDHSSCRSREPMRREPRLRSNSPDSAASSSSRGSNASSQSSAEHHRSADCSPSRSQHHGRHARPAHSAPCSAPASQIKQREFKKRQHQSRRDHQSPSPVRSAVDRDGHGIKRKQCDDSSSANLSDPSSDRDDSRRTEHESKKVRRAEQEVPLFVKISEAMRSCPDFKQHLKEMCLFRDWPDKDKTAHVKDHLKRIEGRTKGYASVASRMSETLNEGSQDRTPFVFDIIVDHKTAHTTSAEYHGERLALAAKYAGKTYSPVASATASSLAARRKAIAKPWIKIFAIFNNPNASIPFEVVGSMCEAVQDYFAERANFARADFGTHAILRHISTRCSLQDKEVRNLLSNYVTYLGAGLNDHQLTIRSAKRALFDLLYPISRDIAGVPAAEPPSTAEPKQPARLEPVSQPIPSGRQLQRSQNADSGARSEPKPFVGQPISVGTVGSRLSKFEPPRNGCRRCQGDHWASECPQAYFLRYKEACPGFDDQGVRIRSAWKDGEITNLTKAQWRAYLQRHQVPLATEGLAKGALAVDFS